MESANNKDSYKFEEIRFYEHDMKDLNKKTFISSGKVCF
jgi:hypothetical protein